MSSDKITFGRTGFEVGRLGFGAAPIGYLEVEQTKVQRLVGELLDNGVNLLDTAAGYHGSEAALGTALADRRDEAVIVSKCGHAAGAVQGKPFSESLIRESIDQSLKRLRTDRIDVMLLHSCDLATLQEGHAIGALERARDAGKVRCIGYSGDNEAAAHAAQLESVDVIQTSINIVDQLNIDMVLPHCMARDVAVMAKRPLANAAWKQVTAQPGVYATYAEPYAQRLAAMGLTPHELGYQGHPDVEWPEIALRFVLSQPGVHVAIVGTTSTVNARANLVALGKGPLPEDVNAQLRDAFAQAAERAPEPWRGET